MVKPLRFVRHHTVGDGTKVWKVRKPVRKVGRREHRSGQRVALLRSKLQSTIVVFPGTTDVGGGGSSLKLDMRLDLSIFEDKRRGIGVDVGVGDMGMELQFFKSDGLKRVR